ncbi:MAG: GAF domain-containing sensor histidine kinase [Bacteroidetes bacterium]|nr:GAF domain-containing sensor histidine kinase [Bacteroidota bacterium]
MTGPKKPDNEQQRLAALYEYNILDTLPEAEFDAITRIASQICGTPISLVTIIDADRQWFKSKVGMEAAETSREVSFCGHAILNPREIFEVPDSARDERFFDNPLATGDPHVVFYAGIPLVTENGDALGTLCVIDNKPKALNEGQKATLKALAHQVVCLLELRKKKQELEQKQTELKEINEALEKFAFVTAHDLKSPSVNIIGLARILRDSAEGKLSDEEVELLDLLERSSTSMKNLVDGILKHTRNAHLVKMTKEAFTFAELMTEVKNMLLIPPDMRFEYAGKGDIISSKTALIQILHNLCENAIKYNDKADGYVKVTFRCDEANYIFEVSDNGMGIPPGEKDKIFDLFHTLDTTDRFEGKGTGIGLSTVKKLVEKLNGSISTASELEVGTTITVMVKR